MISRREAASQKERNRIEEKRRVSGVMARSSYLIPAVLFLPSWWPVVRFQRQSLC
jgi:hypothetical protein